MSLPPAVEALADELLALPLPGTPVLVGGTAGLALTHALLERARPGRGHAARCRAALATTLDLLGEHELEAGLWNGAAGIGWTLETLRRPGEDPNVVTDDVLVAAAEDWPLEANLDWLIGLAGLAAYAHVRRGRPAATAILARIVAVLAARAEPVEGGGVCWRVNPVFFARHPDLGVAHGQPGLLVALGEATRVGVPGAGALLEAGLSGTTALAARAPEGYGRADAWCYGPLGVGAVFADLGARLGRPALVASGRAIADATLTEPPPRLPSLGLCHGPVSARFMAAALGSEPLATRWTPLARAEPLPDDPTLLDGRFGVAAAWTPHVRVLLPLFGVLGR